MYKEQIEKELFQAIDVYFFVEDLNRLARSFVDYQSMENFPFGQLTRLHYLMFGGKSSEIARASAAIESLVLALDIFDDLQDQDQPTLPWNMVPQEKSLNIALGLLTLSHNLIESTSFISTRKCKATSYLWKQTLIAVNGQHLDLQSVIETEEAYFHMVKHKSGALTACACMIGALLATDNPPNLVQEYASLLGIIAQMENDGRDILRWNEKSDILAKKRTLPVLFLLQSEQQEFNLIRDYYAGEISMDKLLEQGERIKQLIYSSGALQYTKVHMKIYQIKFRELIVQLPIDDFYKDQLAALISQNKN